MNTKNEMNRINDYRRNDGSRIAGWGHDAGCKDGAGNMSPVSHEEQQKTIDQMGKPQEDQKSTMEMMGKPHKEQTGTMDWTGKPQEDQKSTMEMMGKPHKEQTGTMDRIGTLPEATRKDPGPGRNKRPVVAIREAKRRAAIWGFTVADVVSDGELPYDFIAMKDGITSFVRIRRIRDSWFNSKKIQERCRKEIAAFRAMKPQQGLIFELWIRGFARAFQRYRILQDAIENIGIVLEPETRAGKKALDEEQRATTVIPKHDNRMRMAIEPVLAISECKSL